MIDLSGSNLVIVAVIAVVALCALGVAAVLVRQRHRRAPGRQRGRRRRGQPDAQQGQREDKGGG